MTFPTKRPRNGQTFVFFLVAFVTVFLLCGLGLDSGLYYLSKVRLQRATDATVITGVENFARPIDDVAFIMRNIAVANFVDLADVSEDPIKTQTTTPRGETEHHYAYVARDKSDNITHALTNTITQAAEGNVTEARATATAPYKTHFMFLSGISAVTDLDLVAVSIAERRPRLVTLVLDRSGSMIGNGGSKALPPAVLAFVGDGKTNFDENTDLLGIVSYSSYARLEMEHTKDFVAQTQRLMTHATKSATDGNQVNDNPVIGTDADDNPIYGNGYKFSGVTAADEGMRMALEQMRLRPEFINEQYDKFIVFMTDGEFNSVRSLYAAPTFTNRVQMSKDVDEDNVTYYGIDAVTNSGNAWAWVDYTDTNDPGHATAYINSLNGGSEAEIATNYYFQMPNLNNFDDVNKMVGSKNDPATPRIIEPFLITEAARQVKTGMIDADKTRGVINVWLPPGSVAIHLKPIAADGTPSTVFEGAGADEHVASYYSYMTNSAVNIALKPGEYIDLVLPGYVLDAVSSGYMNFKNNGKKNDAFSNSKRYWPDHPLGEDPTSPTIATDISGKPNSDSLYRHWNLRNRANLLWDFNMLKPEDVRWDGQPAYTFPGEYFALARNFYPKGMLMWNFNNYVGINSNTEWKMGIASTNMLMTEPEFAGNTFYNKNGQMLTETDWQTSVPSWLTNQFGSVMSVQYSPNPVVAASDHNYGMWRPWTYNGHLPTNNTQTALDQIYYMTNRYRPDDSTNPVTRPLTAIAGEANTTGGWVYVYDEFGDRHLHMNSMGYNSRPMYFYDHKDARWERFTSWTSSSAMIGTGNWKALRYTDIAREDDVTVYTVNFKAGDADNLKKMANDERASTYDPTLPVGFQRTADDPAKLKDILLEIAQEILSTLTN